MSDVPPDPPVPSGEPDPALPGPPAPVPPPSELPPPPPPPSPPEVPTPSPPDPPPPPKDLPPATVTPPPPPPPPKSLPVLEDEEPDLPGAPKERGEMGFLDHLEELRMVLLKSFAAVAICMCVVFVFFEKFFALLRYPLERAIGADKASTMLTLMAPMSIITILIQVTLYGGLLLALPVIAYFVGCFIAPALTPREKSILRPGLLAALALFAMGAFGCFFLLLPFGLRFSYNLSQTLHMNNMWNAADYYRMVTLTTLATGLIFEFPLILVILQVLGVIETATLRRHRRYAIMIILVVGGLIAPSPDVSSMLMVSVPMQLLYEASIIVGERLRRRRLAAEAAEAAAEAARFSDAG